MQAKASSCWAVGESPLTRRPGAKVGEPATLWQEAMKADKGQGWKPRASRFLQTGVPGDLWHLCLQIQVSTAWPGCHKIGHICSVTCLAIPFEWCD